MATYFSPKGNPEIWEEKPEGYFTPEEWAAAHPAPEPTFEELRENKMTEMLYSFGQRVSGAIRTKDGYLMQFDTSDSLKMQGAIQLMEATGQTEGYLTQADDTTVYHVPLATMKVVLTDMLAAYAACHARKQELRATIKAAETTEDLDAVVISWPV